MSSFRSVTILVDTSNNFLYYGADWQPSGAALDPDQRPVAHLFHLDQFIQNSGLVPKKRAKRKAVSAVSTSPQ